jgi:hypothetical protein
MHIVAPKVVDKGPHRFGVLDAFAVDLDMLGENGCGVRG